MNKMYVVTPIKSYRCSAHDGEFQAEPGQWFLARRVVALFSNTSMNGNDHYWSVYDPKRNRSVSWISPHYFKIVKEAEGILEVLFE